MRSQSTSWGIVRWSVSNPSRGRHAATRSASLAQRAGEVAVADGVLQPRTRHEHLAPGPPLRGVPLDGPVCRGVTHQARPRVTPGQRLTGLRLLRDGLADDGPVGGARRPPRPAA